MFDQNREQRRFNRNDNDDGGGTPKVRHDWKHYTQIELFRFLDEIKRELPPLQLSAFNLEEELLLQLHTVRALQAEIMDEEGIPANQRAQVANSVAGALAKVIDMQVEVYSSERFKRIESILVRHLSDLDENLAAKFLDDYEKLLQEL